MSENNELLIELYKNADMGVYTTGKLLSILKNKDNKIKSILECELKKYEYFYNECEKLVKKYKVVTTTSGMAKISSSIGIKYETIRDNSDSAMASMLVEGMNMGVNDITNSINKYKKECKREIIKLCKEYCKFQEDEINKLKKYI